MKVFMLVLFVMAAAVQIFAGDKHMACKNRMREVTAAAIVTDEDYGILANATGGAIGVMLPPSSGIPGMRGRPFLIIKTDASVNPVTVVGNGGELINGLSSYVLEFQWQAVVVRAKKTGGYIVESQMGNFFNTFSALTVLGGTVFEGILTGTPKEQAITESDQSIEPDALVIELGGTELQNPDATKSIADGVEGQILIIRAGAAPGQFNIYNDTHDIVEDGPETNVFLRSQFINISHDSGTLLGLMFNGGRWIEIFRSDGRNQTNFFHSILASSVGASFISGGRLAFSPDNLEVSGPTVQIPLRAVQLIPTADVTLTSTPTCVVEGAVIGEIKTLFVNSGNPDFTVTVQTHATLAGSFLRLGASTRVIGHGRILTLMFDGSMWVEQSYVDASAGL